MKAVRLVIYFGVSLPCLVVFAHAADLVAGAPVDQSTVLIDNEMTNRSSYELDFSDNRNTNPGQSPGLIVGFNAKFGDADFMESKADPFGDNPNAPTVDYYTWPKVGSYTNGSISSQNPNMPDDFNKALQQPLTRNVQCYVMVTGGAGHTPPPQFPLVQLDRISVTDVGVLNHSFNNGRDEKTNLYRHELRLDFAGGFADCYVGDDNLLRKWTVSDVTGAFGKALALNLPQSSDPKSAAALVGQLKASQAAVGPFSNPEQASLPGAEFHSFGVVHNSKVLSDDATCPDCGANPLTVTSADSAS